ncbi:MAG TPA: peptidoglycan editing factor PgeF [Terriglobia bacterium]|nr:peptidoglycan editing factor PgeF [Terriglobia bacterium]
MGSEAFKLVRRGGLAWLESEQLARLPWLLHAFSTRLMTPRSEAAVGLDLSLHRGSGVPRGATHLTAGCERNRRKFIEQLGASAFSLAMLRHIHSTNAFEVRRKPDGELDYEPPGVRGLAPVEPPCVAADFCAGDALLTREPRILLSVRTADCLPILIVDPKRRVVAAVHAGWRGALERIIEKSVGEMRRTFDSRPQDLLAAIGPGIRVCCYEIGPEVVDAFRGRFADSDGFFRTPPPDDAARARAERYPTLSAHPPGHGPDHAPAAHLDLVAVARRQLIAAGMQPSKIQVADFCTACRTDLFYSFRKEGARAGRTMAVVGIKRAED